MLKSGFQRAARHVYLTLLFALFSAGAIADRATGFQGHIPRVVTQALSSFIEPGATIWWLTAGGVFQGFPGNTLGYIITLVSNVVFWLVAINLVFGTVGWIRRRMAVKL
jgi:hypothetical protein